MKELSEIQANLKAPKGQFNDFGKYKYRSCEDVLEAVKPLLTEKNCILLLTDEVVEVGGRIYVKATATIKHNNESISTCGYAREEETKKGMDTSQITGAASSYARKYALNGLFCIDDNKDSDQTNKGDAEKKAAKTDDIKPQASAPAPKKDTVKEGEKPWLNPNTEQWNSALISCTHGYNINGKLKIFNIADIKSKYRLSQSTELAIAKEIENYFIQNPDMLEYYNSQNNI